jgi:hypothetical protein
MRSHSLVVRTTVLAVPLVLAFGVRSSVAAPTVYYHAGAWHAFTDKDTVGHDVCGIATDHADDGRNLAIRYTIGADDLYFQASKPNWTIPDNTQVNVSMQIDGNAPWPANATGNGTKLDWSIGAASIAAFDGLFRSGTSLTVSFPSGNEPRWQLSLSGSTAASQTLWRCVEDMKVRDHIASPMANQAPVTQPYAQSGGQGQGTGSNTPPQAPATQPFNAGGAAATDSNQANPPNQGLSTQPNPGQQNPGMPGASNPTNDGTQNNGLPPLLPPNGTNNSGAVNGTTNP